MIIYGHKSRKVEVGTGQFICPKCSTDRTYKHFNMVRYFTLFFIPLFPLGKLGSYVECQTCLTAFKPEDIVAVPGNEQMSDEMAQRNVEAEQQKKVGRGCAIAVIGGIVAGLGCLGLAALTAFQLFGTENPTDDLLATFGLMAICPLPLFLVGAGVVAWGIRMRRSVTEASSAQNLEHLSF